MLRTIRLIIVALAVVLVASTGVSAMAAPSSWKTVEVTLHSEPQQSLLLVSGELPATAKLPYEAELAVPAGTQLQWIGEILGGPASADPELKYVKSTVQGMDVYRFTLTKARIAQVEGVVQGVSSINGTQYNSALKWTAWQALPEVRLSQRVPQASKIEQAAQGATLQPGESGYSYYAKTIKNPKAGDVLDLTFAYSLPAAGAVAPGAATQSSSSNTVALVVVLVVFIGGLGFFALKVQNKMAAATASREIEEQETVKKAAPKSSTRTTAQAKQTKQTKVVQPVEAEPVPSKKVKPAVLILFVVGALIVGVLAAGAKGTSAKVAGGKITKSFGAASPCANASIPVVANQGVDLGSQGEKLVDAFIGKEGIGDVTLDIDRSTVDISFCESSQTEDAVRQILSGTGLVSVGAAPASAASVTVTATIDPSGKKQTASIDTASGSFSPNSIVLKAGVPAELAFGSAISCLTEVIFAELNVKQDLTAGPATVKLPALDAGTYTFNCPMGHNEGTLTVQ